jgi:hypothetical protein
MKNRLTYCNKMWIVADKDGLPRNSSLADRRRDAIWNYLYYLNIGNEQNPYTWEQFKEQGYTVRKVKLIEIQ